MQKRLLVLLLTLLMLFSFSALAEETQYEPLPLGGPAPYQAVPGALSEDGMSYDDGTMKVWIETGEREGVKVYFVYVTIQDASQFRTATAGSPRSKTTAPVYVMAEQNNAVLALNGDYYNYHDVGVVYRSGEKIRYNIRAGRDMCVVDGNGEVTIIPGPHNNNNIPKQNVDNQLQAIDAATGLKEVFSFGPALIQDGERLQFKYAEKNSCGYPTPDERLIFCQLEDLDGRNRYLFIACDDPGLSVPVMTDLAEERGAIQAYNLDGGHSMGIYLCGNRINAMMSETPRSVGDIIYFATLVPTADESVEEGE